MREPSPLEWALRPLKRYADFKGRAPRAEYWWFYLATLIVDRILSFIDKQMAVDEWPLSGLFGLAILVPWVAVTVRRLHDTNRSGWWLLTVIIPAIAFLAVVIQSAIAGGDPPADNPWAFFGLLAVLGLAVLEMLVFMVLPGTSGANRYGADPYRPDDHLEEIFA